MMTSKSDKSIQKAGITRMVFNQDSLEMEFFWNYERQMHIAFTMMMNRVLKKVYAGDEEDYRDALTRHVEFFNITPQLTPFVGGIVAPTEEVKSHDEVGEEAISSTKTALMGPLSGIGGSVFVDCLQAITVGIGVSLAQNGNTFGPVVYFLMYNIPAFIIHYFDTHFGYSIGFKYLQRTQANGIMDKLLTTMGILGVMVIGCMSKGMVWTALNIELSKISEKVTALQSILDGIMPGLIGLGGVWIYFWLSGKKVNPIMLILGTMVLSIAGIYFGILAR